MAIQHTGHQSQKKTRKMMKHPFFFPSLIVFFLLHCTPILAQSPAAAPAAGPTPPAVITLPPAAGPAPPGPTNITKILEKAGHFNVLIRLLKSTKEDDRITNLLNDSSQGLTLFAPNDNAFSRLKAGTLNSLTDTQKNQLLEFHMIPSFLSISQFQTLSNPVNTAAGDGTTQFPLNVTTNGASVNMTTGLVNASVSSTLYTDKQLAVYEVDKVLQPYGIFNPKPAPPSPAPVAAPSKAPKKKSAPIASSPISVDDSATINSAVTVDIRRCGVVVPLGAALVTAFYL